MRIVRILPVLLLLAFLIAGGSGCIFATKVMDIVLTDTTCVTFEIDDDDANYADDVELDYAEEISQVLDDNSISREDLHSAHLVSASHEVTSIVGVTDWEVGAEIRVSRLAGPGGAVIDGPEVIVDFDSVMVQDALGVVAYPDLEADGVELINQALEDFIAGADPILFFELVGDFVDPIPTGLNPIVFDWDGCLTVQIITQQEFDMLDPGGEDTGE